VFATAIDPVGSGLVESLAHPGGNATGFMQFEYSLSGKWLELLKQVSPATVRVGVVRDPTVPSGIGQFAVIQSVAGSVGADVVPIGTRDASEIERPPATLGRIPATDARGLRRRRHYRLRRTCSPLADIEYRASLGW
jgi:putative ABC transport system substrate-binding protein